MPDYKLISEEPCAECDGRGAGYNFQHCRACCGTGRLLVSVGSVVVMNELRAVLPPEPAERESSE